MQPEAPSLCDIRFPFCTVLTIFCHFIFQHFPATHATWFSDPYHFLFTTAADTLSDFSAKKYIVRDRADSESLPLLFSRSFSELSDTFCKTGISFLFAFVPDHFLKCCITPYNCKTFLGSRNSSIQKIFCYIII